MRLAQNLPYLGIGFRPNLSEPLVAVRLDGGDEMLS